METKEPGSIRKVQRSDKRPSVCLNMIVKNEAHVIRRCLASVRPLLDAWCVVDTGSTDGTQDIIRDALGALPGYLYERPWKNFGHNRTEALELARPWADYALIIDADEVLETPPGYQLPLLQADGYLTPHRGSGSRSSFHRMQIVRTSLPWYYKGVVHEVILCDAPHQRVKLEGILCVGHFDSARNQGDTRAKYARDAEILENALRDEPDNARYVFYLAQSYRDAGNRKAAIESYRRRANMGGWVEEVFYSLYQVGLLCEQEGQPSEAIHALLQAYQARPGRREPMVQLARIHRLRKEWHLAYLFAKQAVEIARPDDILFVDDTAYDYSAEDELSIAAYWVGKYDESLRYCDALLRNARVPAPHRPRIEKNREFALSKMTGRL